MATRIELTTAQIKSMAKKYQKGMGAVALGLEYEVSPSTVLRLLREEGVEIRGRGRPATA